APEGEYDWLLFVDGICSPVNNDGLEGTITVSNDAEPSPVLSDVTADPDPYDPQNGDVTFDYTLSGSVGNTTIYAEVYATSDPGTAIKEWTLTNQGNGSNSVTWDGKDGGSFVTNGAYVFKVWGKDGMKDVLSVQESFTVADTVTPPTSEKCAGYTDVAASDSDCDAIEYVKSIGAMTGNPDGTFAPDDLLQRDQIAKISLETFNLYDDAEDYCDGTDPFPDVTPTSWAYQYICRGVAIDMITGYEGGADAGYYRPARSVNRVEFLALILRNLSDSMPGENSTSYDDVMSGQWYSGYAKYSYDNSLFTGNNLYPTQFTTRAEVAAVIFKLHNLGKI
ncbi:MAG TPA: S-layer homology domain-containing protein, partial [Candidatus Gracilibacteria bacterium]|nr:S-layer homology domain-containing protein [Candidatus Gracilibacteria bacterium]